MRKPLQLIIALLILGGLCACQKRTLQMDVLAIPFENTPKLRRYYADWKTTEHFTNYKKQFPGQGLPKTWYNSNCLVQVPLAFEGFADFLSQKKYALYLKGSIKVSKTGTDTQVLPQNKNSKFSVKIEEISFKIGFQSGSELSISYNGKESFIPISHDYGGIIGPFKTQNGDYVYVRFYF